MCCCCTSAAAAAAAAAASFPLPPSLFGNSSLFVSSQTQQHSHTCKTIPPLHLFPLLAIFCPKTPPQDPFLLLKVEKVWRAGSILHFGPRVAGSRGFTLRIIRATQCIREVMNYRNPREKGQVPACCSSGSRTLGSSAASWYSRSKPSSNPSASPEPT